MFFMGQAQSSRKFRGNEGYQSQVGMRQIMIGNPRWMTFCFSDSKGNPCMNYYFFLLFAFTHWISVTSAVATGQSKVLVQAKLPSYIFWIFWILLGPKVDPMPGFHPQWRLLRSWRRSQSNYCNPTWCSLTFSSRNFFTNFMVGICEEAPRGEWFSDMVTKKGGCNMRLGRPRRCLRGPSKLR